VKWFAFTLAMCSGFACAENLVLIADSARVEATSTVVARLKVEAQSAQQKQTGKPGALNATYTEALESSLSDLRAALPLVIESYAKAKRADVVLEPAVAKQFGLTGIDITLEITKALDIRLAKLKFLAP
jgi:Skp family chaperone for outer membrane proteins